MTEFETVDAVIDEVHRRLQSGDEIMGVYKWVYEIKEKWLQDEKKDVLDKLTILAYMHGLAAGISWFKMKEMNELKKAIAELESLKKMREAP